MTPKLIFTILFAAGMIMPACANMVQDFISGLRPGISVNAEYMIDSAAPNMLVGAVGMTIADGNPDRRKYSLGLDYARFESEYSNESLTMTGVSILRYFNWKNSSAYTPYAAIGMGLEYIQGGGTRTSFAPSPQLSAGFSFHTSENLVMDIGLKASYTQIRQSVQNASRSADEITRRFTNIGIGLTLIFAF